VDLHALCDHILVRDHDLRMSAMQFSREHNDAHTAFGSPVVPELNDR
jgi:hypothetical protein